MRFTGQLRSAFPLLAAACLTGCSLFTSSTAPPDLGAVQAYNVTHLPDPESRFALAYPTGDRKTSALLIEQVAPGEVRMGRECSYQIKVSNLTGQSIRGILLRSRPLDGMRITASSATTRPIGDGQIVYEVGDLGPHEYTTIDVRALPDRLGKLEAAYVVNIRPPELYTTLNVVQPVLKVVASGPADVDICQEIVYRYTVSNTGTGVARDVLIQASLPEGLTTADGKGLVSVALGDIPENESRAVTARLKAVKTGKFSTQAVARSRDEAVRADLLVTAAHAPNLEMAIRSPGQEYAGKPVVYSITVKNTGDAPARGAMLKLNTSEIGRIVSVRTETDSGPGEPQLASGVVDITSNSLGTLAPGQSKQIEVTAEGTDGGTLAFEAIASSSCAKEVKQGARTRILTVPAIRIQASDEVDPVPVGQDVVYNIIATNQGTGSDTNVRLTGMIPENMAFVRGTGATDVRAAGRAVMFSAVPRMAPGESMSWKVTLRAMRAGDAQFRISAVSDSLKSTTEKSEPTHLY